jgi:dTDP-4-amino-4,6-dideoxy-D-galactose acyltransferase
VIERLTWDTDHFGVPIGRVIGSTVSADDVAEADQLGLRCLYLLVQAADIRAAAAAEDLDFRVIDERATLSRPLVGHEPAGSDDAGSAAVRPAVAADLVALEPVARTAHVDSRFFADPHFDREAAAMLYVAWLRKSLAGELADIVLVAEDAGAPAGYITGHIDPDRKTVAIGLFGVAEAARGRGLGSQLLATLLAAATHRRIQSVTVVTQGANVAAQRVYRAAGLRTIRSELWLHRWAPDRRPAREGGAIP